MNLVSEEQFNTAMQSPQIAAELLTMVAEDMAVLVAIVGGPSGNSDMYRKMLNRIGMEILAGAEIAQGRIQQHLSGKSIFLPQ